MDRKVPQRRNVGDRGSSLVEALLAAAILVSAVVSIAQLFSIATASNLSARQGTIATILAEQKVEQLRALSWAFDPVGLPVSDLGTDTSATPEAAGGTGLQASPSTALAQNIVGFVDHLGADGRVVGRGEEPPPQAVYTRRWSIEPASADPDGALIIQVLVIARRNRGTASASGASRLPGDSHVVTVKARKAQ